MHNSKENSEEAKDMLHLCEDDLHLLWTKYNTGSYLLNYYETNIYLRIACS